MLPPRPFKRWPNFAKLNHHSISVSRKLGRHRVKELSRVLAWLGVLGRVSSWTSKANWELFWKSWGDSEYLPQRRRASHSYLDGLVGLPEPCLSQWKELERKGSCEVTCTITVWWGRVEWVSCACSVPMDNSGLEPFRSTSPVNGLNYVSPPKKPTNSYVKVLTPSI